MPLAKPPPRSQPWWKEWDRRAQKDGLRHQVHAVNGDCYVGEWKDNRKHENGNRYEGYWQRGMKNGAGRFFHLDHGQLFEGFWVDDVAKCGTMIDFGRDEAPEPTQFPIPQIKLLDPDGVLEEALARFRKTEDDEEG